MAQVLLTLATQAFVLPINELTSLLPLFIMQTASVDMYVVIQLDGSCHEGVRAGSTVARILVPAARVYLER